MDMVNWGLFGFIVGQTYHRKQEQETGTRRWCKPELPPKEKRPNLAGAVALASLGLIVLLFWLYE
ncbi:MAG: hypothetical protein SOZ47_08305 [Lawsonibacter sp.]|nr:hypothetical protein [Lawsonibacter sp.]